RQCPARHVQAASCRARPRPVAARAREKPGGRRCVDRRALALAPAAAARCLNAKPGTPPMQTISVPVSIGELADKISILEIKHERIDEPGKRAHVAAELEGLRPIWRRLVDASPGLAGFYDRLKAVNEQMWDVQDGLREREAAQAFDEGFIQLAR